MKRHLGLIAVVVVILVVGSFFFYELPEKVAVIQQTDQLVSQHKITKFKDVAVNSQTVRNLEALSKKEKITNLSDAEGGSGKQLYYVGQLGNRQAGVVVEKEMPFVWRVRSLNVW